MIRWFARNDIASNFLILGILLWGGYSIMEKVPLEVQPALIFKRVDIQVQYRGGSPADVEQDVIIPIENALIGLQGIDQIISEANNGSAWIKVTTRRGVDPQVLKDEIRTRIDRITTLPPETEPPEIAVPDSTLWFDVIKIAVAGEMDATDLLKAAQRVQRDLIDMPEISQSFIQGASPHEIAIETDPRLLRDYELSFADISNAIRRSSVDLPAGQILTDEGPLMIRSKGQAYNRTDFENIPIRSREGSEVLLKDVATVRDGFTEEGKIVRFNGKPTLLVEALRLNDENALDIAAAVKHYVATAHERFPEGMTLSIWDDSSEELEGRLGSLLTSLATGSLLVLIVLGLFLRPSIAFWVMLGIPVAFAGGFIMMPWLGITANVMSIFGFIIVVGIIVDDAIVTSENVFLKLREGLPPLEAATSGAGEVAVPVTFGALTTIVAFIPLMAFDGFYGSFTQQIPPIVTSVLIFSLIESKLVLPGHLKFVKVHRGELHGIARWQKAVADSLETVVRKFYEPSLRAATRHRYATIAVFFAVALASFGYIRSGKLGFVNMPSIDRNRIRAEIRLHRDAPIAATDEHVLKVAAAVETLRHEFIDPGTGKSLIGNVMTSTGGWTGRPWVSPNIGYVVINVTDPGKRSEPGPRNSVIAKRWTELVGELPEAQSFWISGEAGGGFHGEDDMASIAVELRGPDSPEKDALADRVKELIESYEGIASAWSRSGGLRDELQIRIRPEGEALGLTQIELARQVRAAFYGEQAQRIQRDRDDVRVMVRLPKEWRESLDTLNQLRIRTPAGGSAPFHSIATAGFTKARGRIERVDGAQVIKIMAKPDDEHVDVIQIARDLAPQLQALLNAHPNLSWRYTDYVAEHEQTKKRSIFGGIALFFALYALLAIPFRSLYQPFFVMIAVPFGAIGAMAGHLILDITPSYLSVFGILALAGVVVNDSLVMVDFINQKVRAGEPVFESVIQSGTRRFRPIFLTSATTFVGLMPIFFDHSLQAQFLIPMAASLAFGILFATLITLYLIPSAYMVAEELLDQLRGGPRKLPDETGAKAQ